MSRISSVASLYRPTYEACHDNDVWVEQTDEQFRFCVSIGNRRRAQSLRRGDKERSILIKHIDPADALAMASHINVIGAIAEGDASLGTGIPWEGHVGVYQVPDLEQDGVKIEVKAIRIEHYGLRVYESIPDDWYVLAVIIPVGSERGAHRIPGWIRAGEAKQHDEWRMDPYGEGKPFYAMPQKELNHLDALKELIDNAG